MSHSLLCCILCLRSSVRLTMLDASLLTKSEYSELFIAKYRSARVAKHRIFKLVARIAKYWDLQLRGRVTIY